MIHPDDPANGDTRDWPTLSENDTQIHELLELWENAREQGRYITAEELCDDQPELLDQVRQHIHAMESIAQYIGEPSAEIIAHPTSIDEYEVLGELGQGGIAIVYLCQQDEPRRRVAVKLMQPGRENSVLQRRFKLEADILAALRHPGIAEIYETGCADCGNGPQSYYVMEYIEGKRLDACIGADIDERASIELFIKICEAVEFAHQHGVIHRDLKPSNILVDRHGQPKILDFGIARLLGDTVIPSSSQSTTVGFLGTPPYMSPEQFNEDSKQVDTRSDLYSLGVILYQLLSGQLPYDVADKSLVETAKIVGSHIPVTIGRLNPRCRGDLEIIVAKTLEKNRADRYQHVSELAQDLQRYLDGEEIVATKKGQLKLAYRWYRRNQFAATMAALAIVTLVVGFAVSLGLYLDSTKREHQYLLALEQLTIAEEEKLKETERLKHSVFNSFLMRASEQSVSHPTLTVDRLNDLRRCPPHLRNVAYHLIRNRCQTPILTYSHDGEVVCSAFSPDGRYLATVGRDRLLRIRELDIGRQVMDTPLHVTSNSHLKFVDDHTICFSNREEYQLIDISSGRCRSVAVRAVDFPSNFVSDANAERFVSTSPSSGLQVRGFDSDEVLSTLDTLGMNIVDVALDKPRQGMLTAVTRDGTLLQYDDLNTTTPRRVSTGFGHVRCVAHSRDGGLVALGRDYVKAVMIDSKTGETVREFLASGRRMDALRFAEPVGQMRLILMSRSYLYLWDMEDPSPLTTFSWQSGQLTTLSVSSDGSRFAAGGIDHQVRLVQVLPPVSYEKRLNDGVEISRVVFSPRGNRFAFADLGGNIYLTDVKSGQLVAHLKGHRDGIMSLKYSTDGRYLVSSDRKGEIYVWDGETGSRNEWHFSDKHPIRSVAIDADASGRRQLAFRFSDN